MKLSKEVKVGLLAIAALTIVYIGFNFLKGAEIFSSNNSYYTVYDNCQGLRISSSVVLSGIPVGRVRDMRILPDKKHSVLVTFETEKQVKLTDTTKARLISTSILGDKVIDLLIEEGNPLKNYDTVPSQVTSGFGDMITNNTFPDIQGIKNISVLTVKFIENLIENTDRINNIFANLEDTTRNFKQVIAGSQENFYTLSRNITEVSSVIADRKEGIGSLLIKLNKMIEGVKLQEAQALTEKLHYTLDSVGKILEETKDGRNNLGKILYDDSLYKELDQTLNNLDALLIDLKRHPWRYVNFSIFGTKPRSEKKRKQ